MLAVVLVGVQVWLAVGATLTSSRDPGTTGPTDAARPYESRPQTVIMAEESPVARNPPSQRRPAEQAIRVLTLGWQLMPPTNLKQVAPSKRFLDTAFFLRNLGICLIVLKLVSSPQAQLITAMCLQLLYVCYFVYCSVYRENIEFVAALSLEALILVAILLKTLSTTPSISESNLQTTLGLLLLIVLAVCMVLIAGAYSLALISIWRSEETSGLDPKTFKPCALAQPNAQPGVSTPADPQIPSNTNLRIVIEDKPAPSPTQVDAGRGFSMHSIPDEGMNPQTFSRSVPVTEQPSE